MRLNFKTENLVWGLVLVCIFAALTWLAWAIWRRPVPLNYEGVVVEKWAGYAETDEGSRPYYRLVIESEPGQRTTLRVAPDIYHRAEVGMRIKESPSGIELSPPAVSTPGSREY